MNELKFPMTPYEAWDNEINGMYKNRGRFVTNLFHAYRAADADNKTRLALAFPEHFMMRTVIESEKQQ
jgi:hypothetical protein